MIDSQGWVESEMSLGEWAEREMDYFENGENDPCDHCNGDGWGIVGLDWDCDDGVNGPFDGEEETCPWCHGSGRAADITSW